MESVFLVVLRSPERGVSISKFNEASHVLAAVGRMENVDVERVFLVDEQGNVIHYNLVFKGKLKLEVAQ